MWQAGSLCCGIFWCLRPPSLACFHTSNPICSWSTCSEGLQRTAGLMQLPQCTRPQPVWMVRIDATVSGILCFSFPSLHRSLSVRILVGVWRPAPILGRRLCRQEIVSLYFAPLVLCSIGQVHHPPPSPQPQEAPQLSVVTQPDTHDSATHRAPPVQADIWSAVTPPGLAGLRGRRL